jgi:aerotaxis receptor
MGNERNSPASEFDLRESEMMVCCTDNQTNLVYVNHTYQRWTGFTPQEAKAMPSTARLRDVPPQVMIDMSATLRQGRPWTGLVKAAVKDERDLWCRLDASPLLSHGKYIGSLMVLRKPAAGEISRIEALYRTLMTEPKKFAWREGRLVRLNLWGKTLEKARSLGLKRRIWGGMMALNTVAAAALLATQSDITSLSFWGVLGSLLTTTTAVGWYLSHAIVDPLRRAVRSAMQIASADLSAEFSSMRSDEVGDIVRTLNQVSVNMRATVMDVRDAVHMMQKGTAEIASGTLDLSSRTEAQASSLQETAASMEQINATVQNNADAAHQASELASSASGAAEAGGKVVSEVVSTMERIAHSSGKIADIISVIDGIAFQTNILALNAAVEAARAGEQGRGFAVVAGEVRNLAQRSAQAAKEIKALIGDSVEKVTDGSRLVDSAGRTIADIVAQVRTVTDLVGQIADASREQSEGIGQVSQAVEQLDHMTQVNSTLVEEHTASAASLKTHTERLVETLCVFTLSKSETNALLGRG